MSNKSEQIDRATKGFKTWIVLHLSQMLHGYDSHSPRLFEILIAPVIAYAIRPSVG